MPQKCKPQHFPCSKHINFFPDFSRGFYSLNASHRPLPNSLPLCLNTTCRQTKNKAPNALKSTHAVSILYLGTFNTLCWLAELSLFGRKRESEVRFGQFKKDDNVIVKFYYHNQTKFFWGVNRLFSLCSNKFDCEPGKLVSQIDWFISIKYI